MILNPFIYQSGGGGSGPILLVTVTGATAASVTATKSGASVSLAYDSGIGKWWAVLPSTGTWTVTATSGSKTVTNSVSAGSVAIYETSINLSRLPTGYTELEYIGNGGNGAYVATTLASNVYYHIIGQARLTADGLAGIFGYHTGTYSSNGKANEIFMNRNGGFLQTICNSVMANSPNYLFSSNDIVSFEVKNTSSFDTWDCKIQGVTQTLTKDTRGYWNAGFPSGYMRIFDDGSTAAQYKTGAEIHGELSVYSSSEVLVGNYVPAKRDSDSAVGVYDLVASAFLAATGTLVAGPEV